MNVLIVDDDKLARKGLIAVIDWEQYGLCVVGDVQNGKKALEFLENHPVDLVFTDIDMPEMNGLELMKICKENYPETDFVIFSVYEDFSFARQALRLGALDYISKIEFDPEECDAILKKIVEKYQNKRREKAERNLRTEEDWEGENVRKLEEEFKSGRWIFDENELEKMSEQLSELPLRYAERILVSSFNHLQLSQRDKIPAFETMSELLNWIHSWLQDSYLNSNSKTDDISLCIRAVQYIQEHVTERIRAEAAADAVGMSRGYFSTKFREVTGETFHNCVIRYKMKTAAKEIRKGEKSMTEIALELGYDNFYYFSKLFRKEYGCTPGEF